MMHLKILKLTKNPENFKIKTKHKKKWFKMLIKTNSILVILK